MAVLFNIVIPILAVISLLATLYFFGKAVAARTGASQKPYNVGRTEARITSQVNLIRGIFALIVTLILLGVVGLGTTDMIPIAPPPTATFEPPTAVPVPTSEVSATPRLEATEAASPTSPVPTNTPTPMPTATNTPEPLTATVASEVGVWLRSGPGVESEQLEWLFDGTILLVLPGRESADDLEWQQVQTESGVTGWVAADFLVVNQ